MWFPRSLVLPLQASVHVVAKYYSCYKAMKTNFVQVDNTKGTTMEISNFQEAYEPMED